MTVARLRQEMTSYEVTCWQQFFAARNEAQAQAKDGESPSEPVDEDDEDVEADAQARQAAVEGLMAFIKS
uniref:Uncharacterized protein n=1 Tax=viral metagenome TaxID=1070528 RepID=A0A6M3LKR1_9ZZZZ